MVREYTEIVTHFDLDGVVSAALCAAIHDIDRISFVGPANMDRLSYDEHTIVTDLPHPFPKACGLWFDHHGANIEELSAMGGDPVAIPGVVEEKPSCARVIYDFYASEYELEEFLPLVSAVDRIDGFLFDSFDDWREQVPARIIDQAIQLDYRDFSFMRKLVQDLREYDFEDVAQDSLVVQRSEAFLQQQRQQEQIVKTIASLDETIPDIVVLDMTGLRNPPPVEKNLVYQWFPEAKAAVTVRSIYFRGAKTNGLSISMSLGFADEHTKKAINIGAMMRSMEIGSGHPGAAAGRFDTSSKDEREKKKAWVLTEIARFWNEQLTA